MSDWFTVLRSELITAAGFGALATAVPDTIMFAPA